MELDKYSDLREKIQNQDFETKNKDVDKWLNVFSYFGNIGSIFFAFFLVYPALLKAISINLVSGDISIYLAGLITVLVLSGFELLKRKIFANFAFDFIKAKFKLLKPILGWLLFSCCFIVASFYFSLNGAIEFAKTSGQKNVNIENETQINVDSINNVFNERKQILLDDNNGYRESNKQYRDKISLTPLNYRTVRRELQGMINSNLNVISENEKGIEKLDFDQNNMIKSFETKEDDLKTKNESEDITNMTLFLILSSSIELVIIIGVYFRKYFDYTVFVSKIPKMETIFKKRDRYKTLIKFIFKEGMVGSDEPIIGKTILVGLIKDKTNMTTPTKFVEEFLSDMEYLGIIKLAGRRRYTSLSYQEAIVKIDKFDDTLRLLENLN